MGWYEYKPYVPVVQRRANAAREAARRFKKGQAVSPVQIEGRAITSTLWGRAWCTNLESYSDFENRLPRGRTYARNGSIVHMTIAKGRIDPLVSGSELYEIRIDIAPLPAPRWKALKTACSGQIGSLVELLQGKLSKGVMERVTDLKSGLFPGPYEITMSCSCPDYTGMCKHVAAVTYGVGHRLDRSPELSFLLRAVDHNELIEQAIPAAPRASRRGVPTIATGDLGDIFGIEVDEAPAPKRLTSARMAPETSRVSKKKATATAKPMTTEKAPDAAKPTSTKKAATAAKPTVAVRKPGGAKSTTTTKAAAAKPTTAGGKSRPAASAKRSPAVKTSKPNFSRKPR